jgi:hypothetical protein
VQNNPGCFTQHERVTSRRGHPRRNRAGLFGPPAATRTAEMPGWPTCWSWWPPSSSSHWVVVMDGSAAVAVRLPGPPLTRCNVRQPSRDWPGSADHTGPMPVHSPEPGRGDRHPTRLTLPLRGRGNAAIRISLAVLAGRLGLWPTHGALRAHVDVLRASVRHRRAVLPSGIKAIDERRAEGGLALGTLWPAVVRVRSTRLPRCALRCWARCADPQARAAVRDPSRICLRLHSLWPGSPLTGCLRRRLTRKRSTLVSRKR